MSCSACEERRRLLREAHAALMDGHRGLAVQKTKEALASTYASLRALTVQKPIDIHSRKRRRDQQGNDKR